MTKKEEELSEQEAKLVKGIYRNLIRPMEIELIRLRSGIGALEARLPSNIVKIDSVEDFIKANEYAIVDFYSDHCLPCYKLNPALETLASDDTGIAVGKLDIEKYSKEADKYGVQSIPLQITFRNGEVVQKSVGAPSDPNDCLDMIVTLAQRIQIPNEDFDKMALTVEKVAKAKGWRLNPDKRELEGLITALAWNKITKGKQYCPCKSEEIPENVCPCRAVEGKYDSADDMVKGNGVCYCGLYLSDSMMKKIEEEMKKEGEMETCD